MKKIEENIDKAAYSILEPYSLATESEYKRVAGILRKALLEQDRESRADERKRMASDRTLVVAMKKAVQLGIFPQYADDDQYRKEWVTKTMGKLLISLSPIGSFSQEVNGDCTGNGSATAPWQICWLKVMGEVR